MTKPRMSLSTLLFLASCASGSSSAPPSGPASAPAQEAADDVSAAAEEASTMAAEEASAMAAEEAPAMSPKTVVDVALGSPQHATLVQALKAAGLVEALQGEGPFTVFAPTDAAFEALPEGALDALLADPTQLADVLKYHVVPGKVMAADVAGMTSAETLGGASFPVDATEGGVTVGGAEVLTADLTAENGVVHVIDRVLMPPE